MADIIIYCLSLPVLRSTASVAVAVRPGSNALDLGVSSAVLDTLAPARSAGELETNEHRYPADEFRGRFRRLYP